LRIAQVAPLYESVPPQYYGGTERVVSYLTEELVKEGHDVTLYASADSVTSARLVASSAKSLRLDRYCEDQLAHHMILLDRVFSDLDSYDFVHFHLDYLHYPFSKHRRYAHVTTLHGRLDLPDLVPLYRQFSQMPVVSISKAQREPLPWLNWQGTVYHGLPADMLKFHPEPGKYLAFMGRISPEKRLDRAIKIAARVGIELRIAAKVDAKDQEYFTEIITPLLKAPNIDYIGEIGEREKDDFLGNAFALLFPIDWPEPFGLVMIEANACGTPVIAYDNGSVPEVIENGVNGVIVNGIEDAIKAVDIVQRISREQCRAVFDERFTAERMANDYLAIYKACIESTMEHAIKH
jgi:glycosyltransferase involved in cell wall biosynthesis